jgi:succinate dehydrogenase hydrophobic anchor subunit
MTDTTTKHSLLKNDQSIGQRAGQGGAAGSLWLIQAFTGLLLIIVLGLHMVAHHFVVEGGLRNFAEVVEYIGNPVIFAIEIIFLLVVTPHAMLGLRAIALDLGPSPQTMRVINWALGLVGVIVIIYGVWLAIALQQM